MTSHVDTITDAALHLSIFDASGSAETLYTPSISEIDSIWGSGHRVGILHTEASSFRALPPDMIERHKGRMLVTSSAARSLPQERVTSPYVVERIGAVPLHLCVEGWRPEGTVGGKDEYIAKGWVAHFVHTHPDLFEELRRVGIADEGGYVLNEHRLEPRAREKVGVHRFVALGGYEVEHPLERLPLCPPWALAREISGLVRTVRLRKALTAAGILRIRDALDVAGGPFEGFPGFSKTVLVDLHALLLKAVEDGIPRRNGARIVSIHHAWNVPGSSVMSNRDTASSHCVPNEGDGHLADIGGYSFQAVETMIVQGVSVMEDLVEALESVTKRERNVLSRRLAGKTLQRIGDQDGMTRERARQLEVEAIQQLRSRTNWPATVADRVLGLHRGRSTPLTVDDLRVDSWFRDLHAILPRLDHVLGNVCGTDFHVVNVDGVGNVVARIDTTQWRRTLVEARRKIRAARGRTRAQCRAMVTALLPEGAGELQGTLWSLISDIAHFAHDENGEEILMSTGRGNIAIIVEILEKADAPLRFSEIVRRVDPEGEVHTGTWRSLMLGDDSIVLFDVGTYGLERHLPFDQAQRRFVVGMGEDILSGSSRQWHANEILAAILDDHPELPITRHTLDHILRDSFKLHRLSRLMWMWKGADTGRQRRLGVSRSIHEILIETGHPLTTKEIKRRLKAVRGINANFQVTPNADFVRVGHGEFGLNDRDVSVSKARQGEMMDGIESLLRERGEAVHESEWEGFVAALPPDLRMKATPCFSILSTDDRFRTRRGGILSLDEW